MNANYFQLRVGKPWALPSCGKLASCAWAVNQIPLRFISNCSWHMIPHPTHTLFRLGSCLPLSLMSHLPTHLYPPQAAFGWLCLIIAVWVPSGLFYKILSKRYEMKHIAENSQGPECTHRQKLPTTQWNYAVVSITYAAQSDAEVRPSTALGTCTAQPLKCCPVTILCWCSLLCGFLVNIGMMWATIWIDPCVKELLFVTRTHGWPGTWCSLSRTTGWPLPCLASHQEPDDH